MSRAPADNSWKKYAGTMTDELANFLEPFEPEIQRIVREVRQLLLECIPGVVETSDRDGLGFGIAPGYKGLIAVITPYKNYVNLGIYDGASIPDPQGLMQGSGKRHRHVKIKSRSDLENPGLKKLIETAVQLKTE
jgi:hypothetical protein